MTSNLDPKLSQLSENSKAISLNAASVRKVNDNGAEILDVLKVATDQNTESTERIANAVKDLDDKSMDLDNILVTISSIAE